MVVKGSSSAATPSLRKAGGSDLSALGVASGAEELSLSSLRFDLCPKLALGWSTGNRSTGSGGSEGLGLTPTNGGVLRPDAAVLGRGPNDGVYSLLFRDSLLGLITKLCKAGLSCKEFGVLVGVARPGIVGPFWNEG